MRPWLLPTCLVLMILSGWHWRVDLRRGLLGEGAFISNSEIQMETAKLVFRYGTNSNRQEIVVQRLQTAEMIRQRRSRDVAFNMDVSAVLTLEMQEWRRQWEDNEERQDRLGRQGLTEVEMENNLRETLLDQAWIEQRLASAIQITEADLRSVYQAHHAQFKIPPSHRVAHLFLSRHKADKGDRLQEIQSLQGRLIEGEAWETLVSGYSEDNRTQRRGGDLGWMTHQRVPTAFFTALKRLKLREISPPVSTPLGWHLIRVIEHHPERLPTLEEMKPELMSALLHEKRRSALSHLLHRHPGGAF